MGRGKYGGDRIGQFLQLNEQNSKWHENNKGKTSLSQNTYSFISF